MQRRVKVLESGLKGKVGRGKVKGFEFCRQNVVILSIKNVPSSVPHSKTRPKSPITHPQNPPDPTSQSMTNHPKPHFIP